VGARGHNKLCRVGGEHNELNFPGGARGENTAQHNWDELVRREGVGGPSGSLWVPGND